MANTDKTIFDADFDEGVELNFVRLTPRFLYAGHCFKDQLETDSAHMPITYSYGMSSESQKAALFQRQRRAGEPLDRTSFKSNYLYEAWADKDLLVGLCDIRLHGTRFLGDTWMKLSLEAIYVKPRYRRKGICQGLCDIAVENEFQRMLTEMLSAPDREKRQFKLSAEAELHSLGGHAAILRVCDELYALN